MVGDLYNIADRIRAIDKDLRVIYDRKHGKYTIYHKKQIFMTTDKLDHELYNHIKKTVWENRNIDIVAEIEKNNLKFELDKEKKIEDIAYNMAKDIRKPLLKELYY